ncbi:MAG: DNA processing protein [Flavobacteriales bacterium]
MRENNSDIRYQIALLEIEKVGISVARKLIDHFGSAKAVFEAAKKDLLEMGSSVGHSLFNGVQDSSILSFADAQIQFSEEQGNYIYSYYDEDYPNRLKHCPDAPLILYVRGDADLNHTRMVAIVGTRQCTEYGRKFCEELVNELQYYGAYVVSGLAFGIDYCAHRLATDKEVPNMAVLAHGLDRIYPSEHRKLANEITVKGALISEFPINTRPDRENFPKRNRIVAGMCDAIVVVESAYKGGSIITAKLGNDYNRDVFAIPGRLGDKQSEGCNHLIKSHQAHLLESAKDLAYILGWEKETDVPNKKPGVQKQLFLDLNAEETVLVSTLQDGIKSIDEVMIASGMPMSTVSTQLLLLEFKGIVRQLPGKKYELA